MPTFPAVPTNNDNARHAPSTPSSAISNLDLEKLGKLIPKSNFSIIVAICSVSFTCLVTLCLCCRRCRKRGRGEMPIIKINH